MRDEKSQSDLVRNFLNANPDLPSLVPQSKYGFFYFTNPLKFGDVYQVIADMPAQVAPANSN